MCFTQPPCNPFPPSMQKLRHKGLGAGIQETLVTNTNPILCHSLWLAGPRNLISSNPDCGEGVEHQRASFQDCIEGGMGWEGAGLPVREHAIVPLPGLYKLSNLVANCVWIKHDPMTGGLT